MIYKKGSFIVVPNRDHLRGQDPITQTVFMWISSYADEEGLCFPSRKKLATDCNVSIKSVDRAIKKLEDLLLIVKDERKNGSKNLTNNYYIIIPEIMQELLDEYKDGGVATHSPQGSDSQSPGVGTQTTQRTIPVVTQPLNSSVETSSTMFDWDNYLEDMLSSKQRHIQIIGFFLKTKEKRFDSLGEIQTTIKRHCKAAKELEVFPNSKIGNAVRKLNYDFPKFTLETVLKELTK